MSTRYTTSHRAPFTSHWSKSSHDSLAHALDNAWRKYKRDYSIGEISSERKVIVSSEALAQAFTEMDNLAREQPTRRPYELAEQVIREMGQGTEMVEVS